MRDVFGGSGGPPVLRSSFCSPVFDKYMTISGFQIEETIDRETSGNLEQLLLAVGRWASVTCVASRACLCLSINTDSLRKEELVILG